MPSKHAMTLFMRLSSHFPALGGDDSAGEVRTEDWCNAIDRTRPEYADEAVGEMIAGWDQQWPPRIGNFQEACRRIAQHRQLPTADQVAIEAPPTQPERINAIITEARDALTGAKDRNHATDTRTPWVPVGATDALEHMATFEELYGDESHQAGAQPDVDYSTPISNLHR